MANASLIQSPYSQAPYVAPYSGVDPYEGVGRPRTVSFSGGRRSRRNSFSHYDQPNIPPVGAIPMGVGGIGSAGTYQNTHGYTIAASPGVPFPGEYGPPSPRYANAVPMGADRYDDYATPGSYGGGGGGGYQLPINAPGSYGGGGYQPPINAPGSYGGGGGGYQQPLGAPGSYGNGGYDGGFIAPPDYRRQRSRSQVYGRY